MGTQKPYVHCTRLCNVFVWVCLHFIATQKCLNEIDRKNRFASMCVTCVSSFRSSSLNTCFVCRYVLLVVAIFISNDLKRQVQVRVRTVHTQVVHISTYLVDSFVCEC